MPLQTCRLSFVSSGQATIEKTVCKSGWTKSIRPPVGYTNALKIRQMVLYGVPDCEELEPALIPDGKVMHHPCEAVSVAMS